MEEAIIFATRGDFRRWLEEREAEGPGVWLLFGKKGGPKTLKAGEALEEALCYGWIDGVMKSLDEQSYVKYFAPRVKKSKWSEKNKALIPKLEEAGIMTDWGREKIREAKENGSWDKGKAEEDTEAQIQAVEKLLQGIEPAWGNYMAMSPSVRRTYARAYADAKTDAGREKRLAWMIDRLNQNLKPM